MFSINFLKEIAGTKPELDVVHRGQGLGHRALYESAALFQFCVPKCGAREKGPRMGSGCRHDCSSETHKITVEAIEKSCSPAQQPGNRRETKETFRTSAGLMVWWSVWQEAGASSGSGSCQWADCPDIESRNDLSPGCCKGGCTSTGITVCLVVFQVEVCRRCGQCEAGVSCGERGQSLCWWWGVKGGTPLSPDLAQGLQDAGSSPQSQRQARNSSLLPDFSSCLFG